MTQIDFYILADQSPMAATLFACKLTDKAYHLKHSIYINTENQSHARQMDEMLWTFSPSSFLPHAIDTPGKELEEPIVIGCPQQTISEQVSSEQVSSEQTSSEQTSSQQTGLQTHKPLHDVMINLDQAVPEFFGQFERVAEIVGGDDSARDQARQRYKYYRDRGYTINTHNIA